MMTLLSASETKTVKLPTYRYLVQLASYQLDHLGVPEHVQLLDVVVLEPTLEAIISLVTATGWLDSFTMVSYWIPADGCLEF